MSVTIYIDQLALTLPAELKPHAAAIAAQLPAALGRNLKVHTSTRIARLSVPAVQLTGGESTAQVVETLATSIARSLAKHAAGAEPC